MEDEFELSTVCHRPEGLEQLQEQTKFTRKELQVLYRGFKNVSAKRGQTGRGGGAGGGAYPEFLRKVARTLWGVRGNVSGSVSPTFPRRPNFYGELLAC